jgi:hypothetical protein
MGSACGGDCGGTHSSRLARDFGRKRNGDEGYSGRALNVASEFAPLAEAGAMDPCEGKTLLVDLVANLNLQVSRNAGCRRIV